MKPKPVKPPMEWCAELGVTLYDHAGWLKDNKPISEPVTLLEFRQRTLLCETEKIISETCGQVFANVRQTQSR